MSDMSKVNYALHLLGNLTTNGLLDPAKTPQMDHLVQWGSNDLDDLVDGLRVNRGVPAFDKDLKTLKGWGKSASQAGTPFDTLFECLHGLYFEARQAHWIISGPNAYSLHLLFGELYESVPEDIDTLAEKMVEMFGPLAVFRSLTWAPTQTGIQRVLEANEAVLTEITNLSGKVSPGMEDAISGMANKYERYAYLLKQQMSIQKVAAQWASRRLA